MEQFNNSNNGTLIEGPASSSPSEAIAGPHEPAPIEKHLTAPDNAGAATTSCPQVQPAIDLTKDEFNWQAFFGFNQNELNVELVRLSANLRKVFKHFRKVRLEAHKRFSEFLALNPDPSTQQYFELSDHALQRSNQLELLTGYKRTVYSEITELKTGYDRVYGEANQQGGVDETLHQTVIDAICDYLKARNNELLGYPVFSAIITGTQGQV